MENLGIQPPWMPQGNWERRGSGAAELELAGRSLDYYNQEFLFPVFCGFPTKTLAQMPKFGWRVAQDVNAVLGASFCWGLLGLMVSLYWATSAVLGHGGIHSPAGIELEHPGCSSCLFPLSLPTVALGSPKGGL